MPAGNRCHAEPGRGAPTYALVCLLALLPITPGGLGLVEGVAVPPLVSFGVPHPEALLSVASWRLAELILAADPDGPVSYLLLRNRERIDGGWLLGRDRL